MNTYNVILTKQVCIQVQAETVHQAKHEAKAFEQALDWNDCKEQTLEIYQADDETYEN